MKKIFFSLLFFSATLGALSQSPSQPKMCLAANEPIGVAKGIFPGRVSWAHNPSVVSAGEFAEDWMSDANISQTECEEMLRAVLLNLTGADNERDAWMQLIASHNAGTPYTEGQKIAVKINNNNTESHADSPDVNATPQMVLALLRSLVNSAGIPQNSIAIAEPSRFITDDIFNKCHGEFPDVRYIDNQGGNGREKVEFVADAMHYSADNGQLARGIAKCFVDADYTINLALLKGHVGQGVTLCAKNWYGAMSLHADWRKNFHNNFDQDRQGNPKYMTFVDFMGHKDLGGKCILYLIDGVLGCKYVGGKPGPKWQMAPFNGEWPASLLASQDPVAIDIVGLDLLRTEFPDAPDMEYADMYLLEAAKADNPPSSATYDPEADGTPLPSLGIAEHWSDPSSRTYTTLDLRYLPISK